MHVGSFVRLEGVVCSGGRLLADFVVGTTERPSELPSVVARCLTQTLNEEWLIWATKIA